MGKAGRTQWHHVAGSTGLVALQPQHFLLLKLGKSCMVVGACRCTGECRGRQLRNSSPRYSLPCGAALSRGVKWAHPYSGSSLCLSRVNPCSQGLCGGLCVTAQSRREEAAPHRTGSHSRPHRKRQHLHRHSWFALGKRKINVPSQVTQPLGVNVKPKILLLV